MVVAGGAAVVAVSLAVSGTAGAILAVVLLALGIHRAWGLVSDWRRSGA